MKNKIGFIDGMTKKTDDPNQGNQREQWNGNIVDNDGHKQQPVEWSYVSIQFA